MSYILWEYVLSEKSVKVYTVVEDLCVEDINVLHSCVQLLSNYKLDLLDWIVKAETIYGVHWYIFCVIYFWVKNPFRVAILSKCVYKKEVSRQCRVYKWVVTVQVHALCFLQLYDGGHRYGVKNIFTPYLWMADLSDSEPFPIPTDNRARSAVQCQTAIHTTK